MASNQQQQTTGQRATTHDRRRDYLKTPDTAAALEEQLTRLAKKHHLPVRDRRQDDTGSSPPSSSLNSSFTDIRNYTPGIHSFSFRPIGDHLTPAQVDALHGSVPLVQNEKTLAEQFLQRDDAGTASYID